MTHDLLQFIEWFQKLSVDYLENHDINNDNRSKTMKLKRIMKKLK